MLLLLPYIFLFILFQPLSPSITPTCSDPIVYSSTTPFSCSSSNNYIQPSSSPNFPLGTPALTVVVYFNIVSYSDTGCSVAYPREYFSITITVGGTEYLIASLAQTAANIHKYYVGDQYGSSAEFSPLTSGTTPFVATDWVEVKAAIDLSNNQAVFASTFARDLRFDAVLPSTVDFNPAWTFDGSMKIYFGGRPGGSVKVSVLPKKVTIWNTFLPTATRADGTIYTGILLFGQSPILVKEFLMKGESGYSLSDSMAGTNPAYLGTSTSGFNDTMSSPYWDLNRALKFNSSSQYLRIPAFTVAQTNELVLASLTLNFWIKITTAPASSAAIFRFSNSLQTMNRFFISHDSSLNLYICAGNICGLTAAIGLTLNNWHQVTVTWAIRNMRTATTLKCYFTVHIDTNIVLTSYLTTNPPGTTLNYDPATDEVVFGNFIGTLSKIQIFSPGALQIFKPSWCTLSDCGASLGASNPPVCVTQSSCHSSCDVCVDGSETGCLACSAGKKFYKGKCVAPCPAKTYTDVDTCEDCSENCEACTSAGCSKCRIGYYLSNGLCYSCPKNCDFCANGLTCTQCQAGFFLYQDDSGRRVCGVSENLAEVNKVSKTIITRAMKGLNILFPFSTLPFVYGALSKIIQYTRYMNISRSTKLENLYVQSLASIQIIPTPTLSDHTKGLFKESSLPYMFEKYELSSSFMVNFGDELIGILTFMGLFVVALGLKRVSKWLRNIHTLRSIINRMKLSLQNYVIGQIFESFTDIVFYASLEFRTLSLKEKFSVMSFLACLFCLAASLGIFYLSIWIIKKYQVNKRDIEKSRLSLVKSQYKHEEFNKKYEGLQLLYEDFNDENVKTQAVILYFGIHNGLFSLIITLLYQHPIVQSWLLIVTYVIFLIFLVRKRPIKSKIDLAEMCLFELILLIMGASLLVRALAGENSGNVIEGASNLLIGLNMIFTFAPYGFMIAKLCLGVQEFYQQQKETLKRKKRKGSKKMDIRLVKRGNGKVQEKTTISVSDNENLNETVKNLNLDESTVGIENFNMAIRHKKEEIQQNTCKQRGQVTKKVNSLRKRIKVNPPDFEWGADDNSPDKL